VSAKVFVIGVGMTKFEKPGSRDWDYHDMARESGTKALADAGVAYDDIEQAFAGYCYGESTCGQEALYEIGLSGVPIVNVNNNCSTGSSALYMARQTIAGGLADCTLAIGFEKMEKGSLGAKYTDRRMPMSRQFSQMIELRGFAPSPPASQVFGNAGREHMERYGTTATQLAKIGEKNHRHSVNNPYSQFRDEYSLDDILAAPMVYEPLTKLQCCPTSDGSGAAVLASERFVDEHGLRGQAVEIVGQAMTTDGPATFETASCINLAGADMTRRAAQKVYEESGLGPEDVDVIELHDCFSANELITYEALGLCAEGDGGKLIDDGAVTYGGQWVVNPSGGLISKGHPLGATGLAQCSELTWQLRGQAEARQVEGASVALQHNIGLGGAAVVTMYRGPQAN
jgi:acetyl-CoA acetyltransferase